MARLLAILSIPFLLFSCTVVTSTNIPGKKCSKMPSPLLGKYSLELSEDLKMFMGEEYQMTIQFMKDRLRINDGYNNTDLQMNDSVFISTIKKNTYLTMGAAPNYSVMKIKKYGKDLYLFPMFMQGETVASDVSTYFANAVDIPGEVDENGEMGFPSISVTIDDAKLENFFSSQYCITDSFLLRNIAVKK